uniref:Rho-GAP domain-containing protein n=1 Tax=Macrostomum lignano TaxID=282301 RepID=A0A1I8GEJ0_9PLAT
VERAHSEYVQTNTKSTSLVLVASTSLEGGGGTGGSGGSSAGGGSGGPPQLRGDPKHEAKLRCIEELNGVTEQREKKKLEILRSVRELIERGDQCFIAATCGFFECYARAKESNNQELRSLSRTSHQNYRPGSKFREFVRTCISLDSDDPPPRFTFEEFGVGGGSSGPPSRKESRGSGEHYPGTLFTADVCDLAGACCEDEIEEDDEESSAGETVCVATATATAAAYATSTSTATATSKLGLATRIWCSTRDTASSLLQFRDKRQTLFKKPASTGHLLGSESQHQHQHHHHQLMLARQVAKHAAVVSRCIEAIESEGAGLTISGVYRVQASKRRVLELSAQCDSTDEPALTLQTESVHTVCGLLKHRLLQLPDALLTGELYSDFIEAGRDGADPARLSALVARLPRANRQLAGALFHHLARVADRQADNQMSSQNLALVFAPTVLRPRQEAAQAASGTASLSEVLDYGHQKLVAKALIDSAEVVFGPAEQFASAELQSPDSGGGGGVGGGGDRQFLMTAALHVSLNSRVEASSTSSSFNRQTRQQLQQQRRPPSAFDPQGVDFDDIDVDEADCDGGEALDAGGGSGLRRVRTTGGGGQAVRKEALPDPRDPALLSGCGRLCPALGLA